MENNNEEFDEPKVSMTLEDGTELECDVIAIFPVGDREYIALLPDKVIPGYEENEVFLYRYKELAGVEWRNMRLPQMPLTSFWMRRNLTSLRS